MRALYAFQGYDNLKMAKVIGKDLPISTKQAIEISKFLKNKTVARAKAHLEQVLKTKAAIPFTRYTNGLGHRRGPLAAGRYPVKASEKFIELLDSVAANAQNKGLGSDLEIIHMCAHKAAQPMHPGRQRGRVFKRTHVEIVVKEAEQKKRTPQTRAAAPAQHTDANKAQAPAPAAGKQKEARA